MAVGSTVLDPYAALGVPHDASPATIRSSYKKLMLQCHPDKVRDEAQRAEKAQQFQKVQEAYELLIDSRRRRKYD
ncbi:heat shock protein DnaJ, partial [Wilcoxina mikolae CBS 423.85]